MRQLDKTHIPCPSCRDKGHDEAGDNLALFENKDGTITGYCFKEDKYFKNPLENDYEEMEIQEQHKYIDLEFINKLPTKGLSDRGISKEATEKFGVKVLIDETTGEPTTHYYPYYIDGKVSGYKERKVANKEFHVVGNIRGCELFGQHLVNGKNFLIIVEGECDALATYDLLKRSNKNYNVVSLINGANKRSIQNNLEFVESFESVVLAFDNDEPGNKAARQVADLLSPGKAKIASLPCKDPNECLKENKTHEFLRSIFNAKEHRPDGIIRLSQAYDELFRDDSIESIPYPWEGLNRKLYGIRPREIVTITSGSGMGKSAIVREIEHWLFKKTKDNIGVLALEESIGRTQWGILSIQANLPLHIREERKEVPRDKIRSWWDETIGTGRFISYDHFGSTNEDNLINQVRYLIRGMDCKWIILDHLSIVVSSMDEGGDERKTIDSIMTKLRTLVEETGAGLILVSHLRRPSGDKGHEMGATVTLSQLRGSHSIAQLSDAVIGLERNQQAKDEREQNLTKVTVLKNRYSGYTGLATSLFYNRETGRLYEVEDPEGWFLGEVEERLPQ